MQQRLNGDAGTNIQRPRAFGAVNLVGGQREQVCARSVHSDGQLAEGLDGVRMQPCTASMDNIGDFAQGLDRADFIVGVHDGHQHGVFRQRGGDGLRHNGAELVNRQGRNPEPERFQEIRACGDAFKLNG